LCKSLYLLSSISCCSLARRYPLRRVASVPRAAHLPNCRRWTDNSVFSELERRSSHARNKGHFINVLPDNGLVTFLALVRERELRPKRSGGVYLHLLLGDRTGEVEGRVWDGAEEIAKIFEPDDVLKVRGTLERYNGKSQVIVQRIRRCQAEEFDESDFCPISERDPDEMLAELHSHVERVHSEPLRSLLSRILGDEDLVRVLKVTPGAMRLHHAYRGGLLQHMLSVLGLALKVTEHYPRLDLDLLVTGAILHDIGKIEELTATRRLGYTTRGQLVGHVALGLEILERHVAGLEDFPLALKTLLQHLNRQPSRRNGEGRPP
jgi:3'-5' exoribonuclease